MFSGELFNCRRILSAELVYTLAPARVTEAREASLAPALLVCDGCDAPPHVANTLSIQWSCEEVLKNELFPTGPITSKLRSALAAAGGGKARSA